MNNNYKIFVFLVLIFLGNFSDLIAQKYWVGGSGEWSDISHWSDSSGGKGGSILPNTENEVIIDHNSFSAKGEIRISGNAVAKSLVSNVNFELSIVSAANSELVIVGKFSLNQFTKNLIIGKVHLINKGLNSVYKIYMPNEFVGIKNNPPTLKVISDQFLQVTTATFTVVDQTCPAQGDGSITITPTNGTGPFTYQWVLQGATGACLTCQTVTGVSSGGQTVIVTDLSDPIGTIPGVFNVNMGPSPFVAAIVNGTNISCFGGSDGTITSFSSGGTAPHSYVWTPAASTNTTPSGLSAGDYFLTVTDANGCIATSATRTLTEPQPIDITVLAVQVPVCGGAVCTEDVTFTPSGGTAPYVWSNGSSDINMCPADVYTSTVTDSKGCTSIGTHTASIPPTVTASVSGVVDVSCIGVEDGSGTASGSGGTAPYTFRWIDILGIPTTETVSGLNIGSYDVEVTDDNGCMDTSTLTISGLPSTITASISSVVNVTCAGVEDGSGTASGASGTAPYTFRWIGIVGIPTTAAVSGLAAGNYDVEVTDFVGCKDTTTLSILVPIPPVVIASISTFTDVVCLGLPTGSATGAGAGGTSPYSFLWYDVTGLPTTAAVSNLDVGTYNVQVTDLDGCKDTATVIILAPNPPVITTTLSAISVPVCGQGCTGGGTATAAGGKAPYSYSWFNAPLTPSSQTIANLCPGSYDVAVMDVDGCKDTVNLDISPIPLALNFISQTNIICAGACTGVINITTSGGTPPYLYSWYNMAGAPNTEDVNNVCAGVYNLAVQDASGCRDTLFSVAITQPNNPIIITVDNHVNNICDGDCDGILDLSFTGGNLPITRFEWIDVAGTPDNSIPLVNLCNGTYTFEVEDNLGCLETLPLAIASPVTSVTFALDPLCFGDTDSDVLTTTTGGTAPYTYRWYDVAGIPTTKNLTNLLPGTYHLEVVDKNGCTDTFTLSFAIPSLLVATVDNVTGATCSGVCTGTINSSIIGGTLPYTSIWYDMPLTPSALAQTNLCPGTYNLAVRDANGCRDTVTTTVVASFTVNTVTDFDEAICQGICNGKAWVTASNGTAPYTYKWYNTPGIPTLDTAFNLCVGLWGIKVTDAMGCVDTSIVNLTAPVVVSANIFSQVNNICKNDCDGIAVATASGGSLPLITSWIDVTGTPSTNTVTNLCNGAYTFRATDQDGCFDDAVATITSNITSVAFTITPPTCGGYKDAKAVAVASGGQAPYQLKWIDLPGTPTSNSLVGLAAGTYKLEVTDANNCKDTFNLVITDPFPAVVGVTDFDNISCFGMCDGKAWVTVSGGFAPYSYDWWIDPLLSASDTSTGLCIGTYFVAISDNIDCRDTAAVTIGKPFELAVDLDTKPCFKNCDGSVTANVTGDGAPFFYKWNDVALSTTSSIINLCPNTYKVIVTNSTGCKDSAQTVLLENPEITSTITFTQTTCSNTTDGSADVVVSGGTANYKYLWSSSNSYSSTVSNPNDLTIGKYYVLISDKFSCSKQDSVTIDEVFFIDAFAGSDKSICEGDTAKIWASGGVSYLWNTGETSDTIFVAPSLTTSYTLTAVNSVCEDEDEITVNVNQKPVPFITADDLNILEGTSTVVYGDGGGNNAQYDWQPPNGLNDPTLQNPTANPLVTTRYYLSVTDQNGCVDTTSILINVFESIFFPDGISPNGDGINDDWEIRNIQNFPASVVEVYNRWGQLIFHNVGYTQRWNGTHNSKNLPVGTYYFIIDLGNDLPKYTGPITILR